MLRQEEPIELLRNLEVTHEDGHLCLQRSILFSLQPVGVGTPDEESKLSFKGRLAVAHSVSFRDLTEYLINAFPGSTESTETGEKNVFGYSYKALEVLTSHPDLRFLEFPHDRQLAIKGLELRYDTRAWCPECIREWQESGHAPYEKKVWTFDVLKICARHRTPLAIRCPNENCNRKQSLGHSIIRPGFCSYCGSSLGNRIKPVSKSRLSFHDRYHTNPIPRGLALAKHLWKQTFIPFGLDKKCPDNATYPQRDGEFRMIDVKWQHWIAKNIEELIVRSQHLPPYILTKQRVHKAIVKCINRLFYGNVDRFAKLLKLRKADLRTWYEGISTPSFEEILHICQFLKTSFLDFLTGDWLELTKPSRSDPAHQLTFKRLREKLEKALSSKDAVPPSFREVALATGYDAAFLFNSFPELCIQLVRRDKELKNNPRIQSLRRQRRDVRKATIECLDYHRYPTLFDVREKLRKFSDPDILEDEDTLATWHKTLKELGLAPYKGENACESMYLDCWMRNHYED